jgi:hypothetical protein
MDASETVRSAWVTFRRHAAQHHRHLIEFIDAVGLYPELYSLFPFTSVGRLCFSRCDTFPYDVDFVVSFRRTLYVAEVTLDEGGWVNTRVLGTGSARDVAALIVSLIPPEYGPARVGTAAILPPSPVRARRVILRLEPASGWISFSASEALFGFVAEYLSSWQRLNFYSDVSTWENPDDGCFVSIAFASTGNVRVFFLVAPSAAALTSGSLSGLLKHLREAHGVQVSA